MFAAKRIPASPGGAVDPPSRHEITLCRPCLRAIPGVRRRPRSALPFPDPETLGQAFILLGAASDWPRKTAGPTVTDSFREANDVAGKNKVVALSVAFTRVRFLGFARRFFAFAEAFVLS
jgi:hypothetical protein